MSDIAKKALAECRAVLAGDTMTGEQFALSEWWARLKLTERAAFFILAGVNNYSSKKQWMQLSESQRAAVVLVADSQLKKLQALKSVLDATRAPAVNAMKKAREKAQGFRVAA